MERQKINRLLVFSLILLAFAAQNYAIAEVTSRSGGTDQTQALIQQLGAERTRLTAENAKLKKKVKDIEGQLEELKQANDKTAKELGSVQGKLGQQTNLSGMLTERLNEAKTKLQELIAKLRETIANLRDSEIESAQRAQEITRLEQELKMCATNNVALSELGLEMLAKYEDKGFWDRVGQKEPFTQIKKVQIENLVDDYKYLIQDQEYSLPKEEISSASN